MIFPFIPMSLALFSCFIYKLSDSLYTFIFMFATLLMILWLLLAEINWIKELMTVYMIGDDGELYRLHISQFWFKINNHTNLLNPMGMPSGKLTRIFFMIQNIKLVLQATKDITFDELVQMGRLTKIKNVTNVRNYKKTLVITADVENNKGIRPKKIRIRKVYDNISRIQEYLLIYQKDGIKEASKYDFKKKMRAESFLIKNRTAIQKSIRFLWVWTGVCLWFSMFTVYPTLNTLSNINSGRYEKTNVYAKEKQDGPTEVSFFYDEMEYKVHVKSSSLDPVDKGYKAEILIDTENPTNFFYSHDYSRVYTAVLSLYIIVILIYIISVLSQYVIDNIKNKNEKKK